MSALDDTKEEIQEQIDRIWNSAIDFCTKILHHADVYGISLMHIPNPNVHQLERLLSLVVIPSLTQLIEEYGDLEPDHGIRLDNLRQYSLHLRNIVQAIKNESEDAFDAAVEALRREPMFPV
tara:strand:+ start:1177 stop:1542 length:366 start_codon:yes stop_codon:yes gene_type:complete